MLDAKAEIDHGVSVEAGVVSQRATHACFIVLGAYELSTAASRSPGQPTRTRRTTTRTVSERVAVRES